MDAAGHQEQSKHFTRLAAGQTIAWAYWGKHDKDITAGISAADVRWLLTYLSRVADDDLRAGLRASGATDSEIDIYTRSIRARIAELQRVSRSVPADTGATMLFRLPLVLLPSGARPLSSATSLAPTDGPWLSFLEPGRDRPK